MIRFLPLYLYALGVFLGYYFKARTLTIGYTVLASFLVLVLIELLYEALKKKVTDEEV